MRFWRPRDGKDWAEFAGVIIALGVGAIVGWFTYIEGKLINPVAIVVAASFFAAYKTIETVVDAFGEENNDFDVALGGVFKTVSGWSILLATGYALVQTLLDGDLWFAISLVVMCVMFAVWGAWRADKAQRAASLPPVPADEHNMTGECGEEYSHGQPNG